MLLERLLKKTDQWHEWQFLSGFIVEEGENTADVLTI